MNELQQVLLVFAVVVIAGLYLLSRSRSTASKKKAISTAQSASQDHSNRPPSESASTESLSLDASTPVNSEFGKNSDSQQQLQASKALNELGNAHIPVSKMTHDRLTKMEAIEEAQQQVEFNHGQAVLSFGEDFDLPQPTPSATTENMQEISAEHATNPEQKVALESVASAESHHQMQDTIDSDIKILGTNEKGGKHHRLVVEDPGMNSSDYHYVAPEYEKPTFGVPAGELGKSPGVTLGEKQEYEVYAILVMSTAHEFSMSQLNHALLGVGLVFLDQGIYVKQDNMGNEIIKVANLLEPGFFPKEDLENYVTPGVAMILELPSTVRAPAAMHDLIMMARKVSQRLEGRLYNMERQIMKESDLQAMRDAAVAYESEPL